MLDEKDFIENWNGENEYQISEEGTTIDSCTKRETKVNSNFLLLKSSKKYFILLPAF